MNNESKLLKLSGAAIKIYLMDWLAEDEGLPHDFVDAEILSDSTKSSLHVKILDIKVGKPIDTWLPLNLIDLR